LARRITGVYSFYTVASPAEEILEQLRALPAAERLRVAERIVHEVADEVTPVPAPPAAVRQPDVLEVIANLPAGTRSKEDIDRLLADERAGWTSRD
jgi:hypothetical protein